MTRRREEELPYDEEALNKLKKFLSEKLHEAHHGIRVVSPVKALERIAVRRRLFGVAYIVSPTAIAAIELEDGVAVGAAAITHDGEVVRGLKALEVVKGPGLLHLEAS